MPELPFKPAGITPRPARVQRADLSGARLAPYRLLAQTGRGLAEIADDLEAANNAKLIARAKVDALKMMGELRLSAEQNPDSDTAVGTYADGFKNFRDTFLGGVENAEVREALGLFIDENGIRDSINVRSRIFARQVAEGMATTQRLSNDLVQRAGEAPDEDQPFFKNQITQNIVTAIQTKFYTPTQGETERKNLLDKVDEGRARKWIHQDPYMAQARLEERHGDGEGYSALPDLFPVKREKLIGMALEAQRRLEAIEERERKAREKRDAQLIADLEASHIEATVQTGVGIDRFPEQMRDANAGEDEIARAEKHQEFAGQAHTALEEMKLAPFGDWEGVVEKHGLIPDRQRDNEHYNARQNVLDLTRRIMAQRRQAFDRDPAAYFLGVQPVPPRADGEKTTLADQIAHLDQVYESMDVPISKRAPLTEEQTTNFVGDYKALKDPDERQRHARALHGTMFGPHTDRVLRHLIEEGDLPWDAMVLPYVPSDVAQRIVSVDVKETEFRDIVESDRGKDTASEVELLYGEEYARSLPPDGPASQAIGLGKVVRNLAMAYTASGIPDPAQQAYSDVFQRYYTFHPQGDRMLRIPRAYDADAQRNILEKGQFLIENILDYGPYRGQGEKTIPKDFFRSNVYQTGVWVANEEETGMVLYRKEASGFYIPVTVDGENPLEVLFEGAVGFNRAAEEASRADAALDAALSEAEAEASTGNPPDLSGAKQAIGAAMMARPVPEGLSADEEKAWRAREADRREEAKRRFDRLAKGVR